MKNQSEHCMQTKRYAHQWWDQRKQCIQESSKNWNSKLKKEKEREREKGGGSKQFGRNCSFQRKTALCHGFLAKALPSETSWWPTHASGNNSNMAYYRPRLHLTPTTKTWAWLFLRDSQMWTVWYGWRVQTQIPVAPLHLYFRQPPRQRQKFADMSHDGWTPFKQWLVPPTAVTFLTISTDRLQVVRRTATPPHICLIMLTGYLQMERMKWMKASWRRDDLWAIQGQVRMAAA